MTGRFATASPLERRQILEEALARVLDRDDENMMVYPDADGERCVWVYDGAYSDIRRGHRLWALAGELEALLA